MKSNEFQKVVGELINEINGYGTLSIHQKLERNVACLSAELGEIADAVKEHVWYNETSYDEMVSMLKEEIGDTMYHVAEMANLAGLDLEEVMQASYEKSFSRRGEQNGKGK